MCIFVIEIKNEISICMDDLNKKGKLLEMFLEVFFSLIIHLTFL